jgi:Probable lipoprotein LpqN
MGIRACGIAAALAVAVGVAGCTVAIPGTPSADPSAVVARPAPPPRPPGEVFRDAEGRFDLVPPPGWTVDTTGAQNTVVIFADPRPSQSPSGRFRANINVILVPARGDLARIVTGARQEVRALGGYRTTQDEPVTLPDGSPAHLLGGTYSDPSSGLALRNVQVMAIRGGTETVVVTGTALADTWTGYGSVFETSLRSLTVAT